MNLEDISDEDRDIIRDNWKTIKDEVEKSGEYENTFGKLKIYAINNNNNVRVILKKELNISISIDKNAKIINFKYEKNDKTLERKELIYRPNDINYFTQYYNMEHPVYSKNNSKDNDMDIPNISVDDENSDIIFEDPNIIEIFDDRLNAYINEEKFKEFYNKERKKVSDYYDDVFSNNEYSKMISNDKFLSNKKRNDLYNDLNDFSRKANKITFLIGAQKIGMTLTFRYYLRDSRTLYINFEDLYKLKKTSHKRKYIYYMICNLFKNYKEYSDFINKYIFEIKGYNDILNVIKDIVLEIKKNLKDRKINIVLDNYDDNLVETTNISKEYIGNIFTIISNSNIKVIFLGRGLYISNLLIKSFLNPTETEYYISVKYFDSLDLDIENIIHNHNKSKKINEIEKYYSERFNNEENIVYNMLLIKNINIIINQLNNTNFPFQFFKFQKENDTLKINFQFEDIFDSNNRKLKEYIAKLSNFNIFTTINNKVLKGIFLEELIISLFMNNKTFKNLNFPEENIIEIENIYKYITNVKGDIKDDDIKNKYKEGPILITQKEDGEVFDFGIVLKEQNIDYFIGGQIGINKTSEEINNYVTKLELNENNILTKISKLTGRSIKEFKFLIILNKEVQSDLQTEYDDLYKEVNSMRNNKSINYEKNIFETKNKKLTHINSKFGKYCCKKENITYYLFSTKDFCFYDNDNDNEMMKIENLEVNKINSLMKGFQYFLRKEYNLVNIISEKEILSTNEKRLFIDSIKERIENFKDLEDLTIEYEIKSKIPLLAGTPWNYAILSNTNSIKVLTYFNNIYIHFVLENNKASVYEQTEGQLFDFDYNDISIQNRYFVKFHFGEENITTTFEKKGKIKDLKNEMKDEEKYYKNNLKYLHKKRKEN